MKINSVNIKNLFENPNKKNTQLKDFCLWIAKELEHTRDFPSYILFFPGSKKHPVVLNPGNETESLHMEIVQHLDKGVNSFVLMRRNGNTYYLTAKSGIEKRFFIIESGRMQEENPMEIEDNTPSFSKWN